MSVCFTHRAGADVQKKFLVERVTDDPTAAYASAFLPLAKEANAAVANPSLDKAQILLGRIEGAIERAGLHESYALARADAAKLAAFESYGKP